MWHANCHSTLAYFLTCYFCIKNSPPKNVNFRSVSAHFFLYQAVFFNLLLAPMQLLYQLSIYIFCMFVDICNKIVHTLSPECCILLIILHFLVIELITSCRRPYVTIKKSAQQDWCRSNNSFPYVALKSYFITEPSNVVFNFSVNADFFRHKTVAAWPLSFPSQHTVPTTHNLQSALWHQLFVALPVCMMIHQRCCSLPVNLCVW